jgi:hypothetical protein
LISISIDPFCSTEVKDIFSGLERTLGCVLPSPTVTCVFGRHGMAELGTFGQNTALWKLPRIAWKK